MNKPSTIRVYAPSGQVVEATAEGYAPNLLPVLVTRQRHGHTVWRFREWAPADKARTIAWRIEGAVGVVDKREAPTVRMVRPEDAPTARYVAEGLGETQDFCPSDNG